MKTKNIALILALAATLSSSLSAVSPYESTGKDPIAAGDVCGILPDHHCEFCDDNISLLSAELCPRCGSSLQAVCSGEYAVNPVTGSTYFYISCYVGSHPNGCQTVQSRCYTDTRCTSCAYHVSGTDTHIQAYFHTKADCYDNCYCSLPYIP